MHKKELSLVEPEKEGHQASPHSEEGTSRGIQMAAKEQPERHTVAQQKHAAPLDANVAWRVTDHWTQLGKLHPRMH